MMGEQWDYSQSRMSQWWREEKGTAKDEMIGWHHRLDGHEFE